MRRLRLLGVGVMLVLILMIAVMYIVRSRKVGLKLPAIGDPYYPDWGNTGYDTQHYDLTLAVDVKNNMISATEVIQAKAEDTLRNFQLDLRGLQVNSVMVNDKSSTFNRTDTKLSIQPTEALAKDALFSTTINYSGSPISYQSEADSSATVGWIHYNDGIVVLDEPNGAPGWYPVNDTPRDKATYTFHITVDKPYTVFANGVLQNTSESGNQITYTWDMDVPMASYLTVVNIAPLPIQTSTTAFGLPLSFVYPPQLENALKPHLTVLSDMIGYLSSILGPYPFKSFGIYVIDPKSAPNDQLVKQWNSPIAYETQNFAIFFVSDNLSENAIFHELTHQWFGNSVSLEDWGDLWLKEGFANYAEWLWREHHEGPDTIKNIITAPGWYDQFLTAYEHLPAGRPPINDLYNNTSYARGRMTLEALRLKFGDTVFFSLLRNMATRYKYGNLNTADFIQLASSVTGQDLKAFLTTWLYGDKLPSLPDLLAGNIGSAS